MKVWTRNKPNGFTHPEDMQKILAYLESHGQLHVSAKTVERLYYDFSDTWDAGWMSVNDEILEAFADWLENIDL